MVRKIGEGVGGDGINWAVLLNAGLLVIVIIGAWFTTFSNPLQEKFVTIEKNQAAQAAIAKEDTHTLREEIMAAINAQEKANKLAFESVERVNHEIDASLTRRFATQDKANEDLQSAILRHFAIIDKTDEEMKAQFRDLLKEIEQRRIEVVTRNEVSAGLSATRLEFLAEIRRLDGLTQAAMPRTEFKVWQQERDILVEQMLKRIGTLEDRMHYFHERDVRDDRGYNTLKQPNNKQ